MKELQLPMTMSNDSSACGDLTLRANDQLFFTNLIGHWELENWSFNCRRQLELFHTSYERLLNINADQPIPGWSNH